MLDEILSTLGISREQYNLFSGNDKRHFRRVLIISYFHKIGKIDYHTRFRLGIEEAYANYERSLKCHTSKE